MTALRDRLRQRRADQEAAVRWVLGAAERPLSFYEIACRAHVRSRITLRTLDRMLAAGEITDRWGTEPHPRRYYQKAGTA